MTPNQLAKSGSESAHQIAFFAWCAVAHLHGFEIAWLWAEKGQAAFLGLVTPNLTKAVPALEWIHSIPNGGARGDDEKTRAIRGGKMKAEGVRQGVADIFLPWPIRITALNPGENESAAGGYIVDETIWCGLYIEMKRPDVKPKRPGSKGALSAEQEDFAKYAHKAGYGWAVCYGWEEAARTVQAYIEWNQHE